VQQISFVSSVSECTITKLGPALPTPFPLTLSVTVSEGKLTRTDPFFIGTGRPKCMNFFLNVYNIGGKLVIRYARLFRFCRIHV